MSDSESLPTGWSEVDRDTDVADKYDPRRPVTYESGDVQVFVHPAAENRPESDTERWQVDVSDRSVADPDDVRESDPLTAEGRDAALSLARDVMEAYNREGSIEGALDAVDDGHGE